MADSTFRAWDTFMVRIPARAGQPILPPEPQQPGQFSSSECIELLLAGAADPYLRDAIELASPSLASVLTRIERGEGKSLKEKHLRKAALALLRYDIRMRTRATPFGLFAGVCGGEFDSSAKWEEGQAGRTQTRVDMEWLLSVIHALEADRRLLARVEVQAHQGLLVRGDRIVLDYPSPLGKPPEGTTRTSVSVRRSGVVTRILVSAREPLRAADLAAATAADTGLAAGQIMDLIVRLAAQELLITALRPPLDGTDPLRHVLDAVDGIETSAESARIIDALRQVGRQVQSFDQAPPGRRRGPLAVLREAAREVYQHDTPVHVDLQTGQLVRLPEQVRREAETAAEIMWRLGPARLGMRPLRGYHEAFLEKYGPDRSVPLLELLDEARGLGAPAGYQWPASERQPDSADEPDRRPLLARLAATATRDRQREVVLDDAMIAELAYDRADPADAQNSCELCVHVAAPSLDALTAGNFRLVMAPSPGSHFAGATMGRFAGLLGPTVDLTSKHRDLQRHVKGAVLADIAFLPRSGRAANLAQTAPVSGRRVTFGLPGTGGAEEIRLDELAVGANMERLCLLHAPTHREVIPVLPNMVSAYAQAPNPARLMFELGLEGQRLWEPWSWGEVGAAPFLPGIRYGRVVLASPTWRLDELRAAGADDWPDAIARWRADWDVPRRILAVSMDQRLLLDLSSAWHQEILREELRKTPDLVAQQVPGDAEGWLEDGYPGWAAEFLLPFERRNPEPTRHPHVRLSDPGRTVTGAGGPWLYFTLRVPRSGQDDFIRSRLPELVRTAFAHGADRWFFIRYNDATGPHLRVRFHGEPRQLWSSVLPAVGEPLLEWQRDGMLSGHEICQYDPEYERYGGSDVMDVAEKLFQRDSEAAVGLLQLARQGDFPYSLIELTTISAAAFAHSFGAPSPGTVPVPLPDGTTWSPGKFADDPAAAWLTITGLRRDLPTAYRGQADRWRKLIDPASGWTALRATEHGRQVLGILQARDTAAGDYGQACRARLEPGDAGHAQVRLVGSVMHMICNRMVGGRNGAEGEALGVARGAVQDNFSRRRYQS